MVEEECRRYKPSKNYLEHLPALNTTAFETELMKAEFERIENRLPMEQLATRRYELPAPPNAKMGEVQAWQECVDNSFAQLEHQSIRALNLELMNKYGCETWKVALEAMIGMQAKAQKELQELKKEIQDVNWRRKSKQIQTGEKLNELNTKWVQLVSCNYEIEQAIALLEQQIQTIKERKQSQAPPPEATVEDENKPAVNEETSTNGHSVEEEGESQDVEMKE